LRTKVTTISKAWKQTLKKAGITKRIRSYDLRHYYASKLFHSETDMKVASELRGYSSPNLTLSTYYHMLDNQGHSAIEKAKSLDL
jgi:integrase